MIRSRSARILVSLLIAATATTLLRVSTRPPQISLQEVVVVTADTEPGAVLDASNLAVTRVPASAVPPGTLHELPTGALAAQQLWKGQYLMSQMITANPVLHPRPDDRVMGVPVTLASAGSLRPGDRVDVIFSVADPKRAAGGDGRILLTAVPVVQILNQAGQPISATSGKTTGTATGTATIPAVVELLVPAADAPVLAGALASGTITLARHPGQPSPAGQAVGGASR